MPKKQKKSDDEVLRNMYPDLPFEDEEEDEEQKKKQQVDTVAELQKQLAEMQAQLAESKKTTISLMSTPAKMPAPPARPAPLDTSKLPDPTEDPQGYARALRDYEAQQENYKQQVNQYSVNMQQTETARRNELWTMFQKEYPDYAENDERVMIAAERVANQKARLGIDMQQYMYGTAGTFMKDVVDYMDNLFGKPKTDDDDDVDDTTDPDGEEDERTGGIFGGQSATARGKKTREAREELGSLTADIRARQMKSGFHA